jgi:hypothetical protein
MEFELLPTPISGKADWRQFRCLKLANGCTVCLGPFQTRVGFLAALEPHEKQADIVPNVYLSVCLLLLFAVNDKESKTTAVAATVNVGASADPRSLPGLARKSSLDGNAAAGRSSCCSDRRTMLTYPDDSLSISLL